MMLHIVLYMPKRCIYYVVRFLYGDQTRFFHHEIHPKLRHSKTGTVAMASAGENCDASQVKCLHKLLHLLNVNI